VPAFIDSCAIIGPAGVSTEGGSAADEEVRAAPSTVEETLMTKKIGVCPLPEC